MIWNFKKNILFGLVFILIASFSAAVAENSMDVGSDQQELFSEANTFFNQANELLEQDVIQAEDLYRKAILRYERLVSEGIQNGKLFYNIGNAYFRIGDVGRAVLNYRRAEQYIPNDNNLQQNLTYVLEQRQDKFEIKQKEKVLKTLFFWHYDLAVVTRSIIFGVFYGILWTILVVRSFWPRPFMNWVFGISFIVVLLFSSSLLVDYYAKHNNRAGVIVASEVVARKGDGVSYQPSFEEPLHAGTEFSVLETRNQWLLIELIDGSQTWVPDKSVGWVAERS
jgi:tetratricopeptide (TPR) repeat protein